MIVLGHATYPDYSRNTHIALMCSAYIGIFLLFYIQENTNPISELALQQTLLLLKLLKDALVLMSSPLEYMIDKTKTTLHNLRHLER